MKQLYSIILTATVLLAFSPMASAQGQYSIDGQIKDPKHGTTLLWPKDNGVHVDDGASFGYSKNISSPQSDGTYWIKLESFATGDATFVQTSVPADIVLVLDISSSMCSYRGTDMDYFLDVNYVFNHINSSNGAGEAKPFNYKYINQYKSNLYYLAPGAENNAANRKQIGTETSGSGNNTKYYLYYEDGGTKYYLNPDGTVAGTTRPAGVTGNTTTLYAGILVHYRQRERIDALKTAVKAFIDVIDHNDEYEDDDDDDPTNDKQRDSRLGNRISIITFAGTASVVNALNVGDLGDGKAATLKDKVDKIVLAGNTRQDRGLEAANTQLGNYAQTGSTRTVVLFTDGEPYWSGTSTNTLYNNGITQALKTKKEDDPSTSDVEGYGATVFTVGLFSTTHNGDNVWKFMNYMSSNAPSASSMTSPGSDFDSGLGFYKDATSETVDLTAVFTEIASQAGGSSTALSAASANVDVVSNSFILPDGTNTDNVASVVKLFFAKLDHMENGEYVFEEEYLKGHTPADYTYKVLNANGTPTGDPIKVDANVSVTLSGTREIKVKGFDYRSCFCGPIYKDGYDPKQHTAAENADPANIKGYQGYKIIIMIPIKMNPDAVGGPNVATNAAGSGIFITDGEQNALVPYISPTVSLPVNIHITKSGLEPGESAKFKIERAILPEGNVNVANLTEWHYVSTVFVTKRQGQTTDPIVKVIGLPANVEVKEGTGESAVTKQKDVVYRITEEPWSWSYDPQTDPQYTNTSSITNPFTFDNKKKDNIDVLVRHAESKATNIFKRGVVDGNVRYDDSKTNTRP
jgi:hypothetical protein